MGPPPQLATRPLETLPWGWLRRPPPRGSRRPPPPGTHLLLDRAQQPLPGLRLCGVRREGGRSAQGWGPRCGAAFPPPRTLRPLTRQPRSHGCARGDPSPGGGGGSRALHSPAAAAAGRGERRVTVRAPDVRPRRGRPTLPGATPGRPGPPGGSSPPDTHPRSRASRGAGAGTSPPRGNPPPRPLPCPPFFYGAGKDIITCSLSAVCQVRMRRWGAGLWGGGGLLPTVS